VNVEELRAVQAPLKARYKTEPASARITHHANGAPEVAEQVCRVESFLGIVDAGLHPAAGGDGTKACSADLLLEALVACAGVTLGAVATSMGVKVNEARIWAEGIVDFRGTLGVARDVPVGFQSISLHFDLESDAAPETLAKLIELTERYCVIYQTLKTPPQLATTQG
jgi:uncharacterized OsmC-like protein